MTMIKTAALAALATGTLMIAVPAAEAAPSYVGSLYQESATAQCPNSTACVVQFTAIPSDRGFLAKRLDCRATVPNTAEVYNITLGSFTQNAISGRSYVSATVGKALSQPTQRTYTVGAGVNNVFVGSTPIVTLYSTVATATFTVNCTVSGVIKYVSQW